MNSFDFDIPVDRSGSLSVKWGKQPIKSLCGNPDALPFWVADMDFTVAPGISEALRMQTDHAVLGYPRFDNVQETFCSWTKIRHHWEPDLASVVVAPGMLTSLAVLMDELTIEGDGVIVPLPAYQPFVRMVRNLNRTLVPWDLRYEQSTSCFTLDLERLENCMRQPSTKVLLFCSPHNPTGRVFSAEELTRIATLARDNHVIVLSDEIHADLVYRTANHIPFDVIARRTGCQAVTCMAPSKTFNIAGEHFSVAVCSDTQLAARFSRRQRALFLGTGLLSTVTALAAYREGYAWLMELISYLESQVDFIEMFIQKRIPRLRFVKPQASFIGFFDCSGILEDVRRDAELHPELYDPTSSPDGGLLSRFFGQRAGIVMNDGTWFGDRYGQFVRFNFGTQRARVEEALLRIAKAIDNLSA
ncbi:MAG: cystathionine beta-lyase [Spirochaetae bacterium HGW-Spirochaetae-8]|nr:MAG: cystathionine beta-lyase [Spirochaetae bacterium HGW-Spirochaetae-8]